MQDGKGVTLAGLDPTTTTNSRDRAKQQAPGCDRKESKMDDNVIVVQFDEPSKAYQALSELNRVGREGKVDVKSAVLLERGKDGTVQTPEGADNAAGFYLASGGLLGMLVGALGGPVGMLLGGSIGAMAGSIGEFDRADDQDVALQAIGERIQPGSPALVAEVTEPAEEVIDKTMAALGGKVTRRPASDVYAEVVAAEDADFQQGVDALKARIHEHHADNKKKWGAFKEKVESKVK
jgi:uncharacterized membrane protein